VVSDTKTGKILDKINLNIAAQKYRLGNPQDVKNQLAHQSYTNIGNYTVSAPMSGQPQDQTTIGQKNTFATVEGGIATVGWPDDGNHTSNNPPVSIGGVSMKQLGVGDQVKYFGNKARVLALSQDRKRARIHMPERHITQNVDTADLTRVGQGDYANKKPLPRVEEAMSAGERMQRALQREKEKREFSQRYAEKHFPIGKKPEPKPEEKKTEMMDPNKFTGYPKNKLGPDAHLKGATKRGAREGDLVGETDKIKGADGKACWPNYRYNGTENGSDKCVKIGEAWELEMSNAISKLFENR
jgi:hypothetical protein